MKEFENRLTLEKIWTYRKWEVLFETQCGYEVYWPKGGWIQLMSRYWNITYRVRQKVLCHFPSNRWELERKILRTTYLFIPAYTNWAAFNILSPLQSYQFHNQGILFCRTLYVCRLTVSSCIVHCRLIAENGTECSFMAWSDWSNCSSECDVRVQNRWRSCKPGRFCRGATVDIRNCLRYNCSGRLPVWFIVTT